MYCPRCHRRLPRDYRFCPSDGQATVDKPAVDAVRVSPTRLTDALLGERYRVRGFIGKGGMARVYLAEDQLSGRPVALKVLEPPYNEDPAACRRFLREAKTASMIGHPAIVSVLEAGERADDSAPYLVMEFLFGESLGDLLKRERAIAVQRALPIFRQVASALAAVHRKGIIHRDIKPDNVFLSGEPGEAHQIKVIDFGLAKLQTGEMTAAGVVMGTPEYMAPEQALAEKVDIRADVYSLGMVMYKALAGQLPFTTRDEIEMLAHHVHTPAPPPSRVAPHIDSRTESVVMTAIRKSPDQRYPDMDIFFDDLHKLEQPRARLWAGALEEDRYEPKTTIGKLVASSLARVLGN